MTSDKEGKKTASAKEREEKDLSSVAKRKWLHFPPKEESKRIQIKI